MGFFEAVGNAAKKAKLSAEIAMIDRELATRKKAFGVELYDIIASQQKQNEDAVFETPVLFKTIENAIGESLERFSKEIRVMEYEKQSLQDKLELMEVRRMREAEEPGLGQRMTDTAKAAEMKVKVAYLDREMLLLKEKFGLEIWDSVSGVQWLHEAVSSEMKNKSGLGIVTGAVGGLAKGVKGTVTKTLGKASGDERAIEVCVNKAKADVKVIEGNKQRKQAEMDAIDKK